MAIKAVSDLIQPDVAPTLATGEVELEIDRSRLASTWTINTAYSIGDVVVPEIRNGHSYECLQPGTSQASARTYTEWSVYSGAVIGDGSSDPQLIWQEVGTDRFNPGIFQAETNIYDINRAAKALARIKMRRCAQFIQDGDVSYQQMYDHWKEQVEMFRPFRRPIQLVRC